MPRIVIKGGVWKNTEDEILKAAVMKYGKNQWARISSLLVRKSPKQCKARWYEWLDPSIKKTEWSKEEDEKLLHLAKIMPCQWRSIAPIIKRTPAQCLDRYEQLLDRAQGRDEDFDNSEDPRKLKQGEIDPTPETKPARPDPVDMDEDEKEMLAEARARLANTQGKKAKRKAREKQLEEARRLASLQKRRELKAAGIETYRRKRRYGIDFNKEIPFERRPAPGFFDVEEENQKTTEETFKGVILQKMIPKKISEIDAEHRREDEKRAKEKKGQIAPPIVAQMNKMAELEQIRKRPRLNLPAPQVDESQLEEIVKLGFAGESAKTVVDDEGNTASRTLLANYAVATPSHLAARTPRTPAGIDTVMLEARNLVALTTAETPLKGGENTPLHPTSFEGITPKRAVIQTPNSVMQIGATPRSNAASTPLRGAAPSATPLRTPMRDELSINSADGETDSVLSTPRLEKARQNEVRRQLRQSLSSLPKPKNEFEVVLPDIPDELHEEDSSNANREEDAVDTEARRQEQLKKLEEEEFKSRTLSVQRGLPRPVVINTVAFAPNKDSSEDQAADALIKAEMLALLRRDAVLHPPVGAQPATVSPEAVQVDKFQPDEIAQAKQLILEEQNAIQTNIDFESYQNIWDTVYSDWIFIPATQKFSRTSVASKADRIASLQNQLEINRGHMTKEAKKASKLESKLSILLGGYQNRSFHLVRQINDKYKQLEKAAIELACFKELALFEKNGLQSRLKSLRDDVDTQRYRESQLQKRYGELVVEHDLLKKAK